MGIVHRSRRNDINWLIDLCDSCRRSNYVEATPARRLVAIGAGAVNLLASLYTEEEVRRLLEAALERPVAGPSTPLRPWVFYCLRPCSRRSVRQQAYR